MRTDLKVGVICLFALVLACVGFFAYHGNKAGKDVVTVAPTGTAGSGLSMAPPTESPTTAPSAAAAAPASSSLATGFGPSHAFGADSSFTGTISPPSAMTAPSTSIIPPSSGSTGLSAPGGMNSGFGAPSSIHAPLVPSSGSTGFGTTGNTSLTGGTTTGLLPPSTAPSGLSGPGSGLSSLPGTSSSTGFGTSGSGSTMDIPSRRSSLEIGPGPSSGGSSSVDVPGFGTSSSGSLSGSTAGTYKIQKNDTFGALAKKNHTTTKAILAANPGVDPTHLKIGQSINLPGASSSSSSLGSSGSSTSSLLGGSSFGSSFGTETPTTRPSSSHRTATTRASSHTATHSAPAGGTYTIKKGDTLRKIAKDVYGDERLWRRIFRANRGDLSSANAIKVGEVIRLPK